MLGVIVPVMNGEKTIERALKCLLNQSLEDIKIIVINDGSTDSTLEILDKYEDDTRLVVVTRENKGYGYSFNEGVGIAKALGCDYVGNLDADDTCHKDFYRVLYSQREGFDVVKSGWLNRFNDFKFTKQSLPFAGDFNPQELRDEFKYALFGFQPSVWSAIYRTDFLVENDIQMLETPGASYQDTAFTFKVWLNAQAVLFLDENLVYYTIDNPNSSVRANDKVTCIVDEYDEIERVCPLELRHILAAQRYGGYMWNYLRLGEEGRKQFLPCMTRAFKRDYQYINPKAFRKEDLIVINEIKDL